jgi:hypothetical protein
MPKGERVRAQSKRTAPPPISKTKLSVNIFNWYPIVFKRGENSISKMIYQNPLEH